MPQNDEILSKHFKDLLKFAREEDKSAREEYLRVWTRLEYYWNNILDIFMDPITHDWRVPDWSMMDDTDPRLINIYRPHGEAIVAALSVTIPTILYHPRDADNPDDIEAAKAYKNITELLELHNEAPMLFIKAIVILFNQGTIFGYNYAHTSPKFGFTKKPRIENTDVNIKEARCPDCGEPLDAGANLGESYACPNCGAEGPPDISLSVEKLPQIVGWDESAKTSICQDLFSGLQVKVSAYATKQEECGYLLLEFAQSQAMLRNIFQDKAKSIKAKRYDTAWESFSKYPASYLGDVPENVCNVSCLWLRPWQFWEIGNDDESIEIVKQLKEKYPAGCYAIFIDDDFMEAYPEDMDEHWTISKNPMGRFIYSRPLGENLSTVQDIRAELVELELQTVEHGIPETFADPKVLNFEKYGQQRAKPGMVTQATAKPGKSLQDGFFTTKTAILSQEVDPIRQHIDQDAQFVVGSFPSVYGGPAVGGSKTASEYSQSRAVALQRLGTIWKLISHFWSAFQSRSAVEYAQVIKDSQQDENFTKKVGDNSFINVWIRSIDLTGNVGRVEPESSEQLPQSWAQKKDTLMQLIQTGIPEITMALLHPRNTGIMKEAVALPDLYIPGEEDRTRQWREFSILSQGIPVPTQPLVDNDSIHAEILRSILEGPQGEALSEEGRNACMMHLQEHMMNESMLNPPQENNQPGDKKNEKTSNPQPSTAQ